MLLKMKIHLFTASVLIALALVGCAPVTPTATGTPAPVSMGELTPFLTATASSTPAPPDPATVTPLPSPTATLQTHTIKAGEDLGGIAYLYHVSVQALLEVNPGLDPYLLKVGSALSIPASSQQPTSAVPSPTPVAVKLKAVNCSHQKDGGAWCFVLVRNRQDTAVESVSAVVRIADADGTDMCSQVAVAPLDLLPSGASLPLMVYFEAPAPADLRASAELLTALPVAEGSERYLPVQAAGTQVQIADDGLSAVVRGTVRLEGEEGKAGVVWILATAYDVTGQVVGVRRWENEKPLRAGKEQPFEMQVYSLGGQIGTVELLAQARP